MASIPAPSSVLDLSSISKVSGEVHPAVTEADGASAGLSFGALLEASLPIGATPGIPVASGSTAVSNVPTFAVVTGHTVLHGLHRSGDGPVVAVPTDGVSIRTGSAPPAESLLDAAGLFRLELGASGGARPGGQERSPMPAFPHEVSLLFPGSSAKPFERDGQGVIASSATPITAPQGQASIPIVTARFSDGPRLDAAHWAEDFGGRLVWMAKENHQYLELRLNPPELGLLSVRMALQQNDAHIAIAVHHSAVREAIEATLPRLRELLAETGVTLVDVDVSSSHGFSTDAHGGETGNAGGDPLYRLLARAEGDLERKGQMGLLATQRDATRIIDRYV